MNFFKDCKTMEELRKEYRRLAMRYHPDCGGDTATMQEINNQYDIAFNLLKNVHNQQAANDTTGRTRPMHETPEEFRAIIEKLIRIPGLTIEICGAWLWVSGSTKEHKDDLKAIGLFWAPKKKMWYWRKAEDASNNRSSWDMKKIRQKYGSEKVDTGYRETQGGQLAWNL